MKDFGMNKAERREACPSPLQRGGERKESLRSAMFVPNAHKLAVAARAFVIPVLRAQIPKWL